MNEICKNKRWIVDLSRKQTKFRGRNVKPFANPDPISAIGLWKLVIFAAKFNIICKTWVKIE